MKRSSRRLMPAIRYGLSDKILAPTQAGRYVVARAVRSSRRHKWGLYVVARAVISSRRHMWRRYVMARATWSSRRRRRNATLWHERQDLRADAGRASPYGTIDEVLAPAQAGRYVMARAVRPSRRRRRGVTLWHERQDPRADAGGASLYGTRRCFPEELL